MNGIVLAERSGTTSWRSLARTCFSTWLGYPYVRLGAEAIRKGVGSGNDEGGQGRIKRTGLRFDRQAMPGINPLEVNNDSIE